MLAEAVIALTRRNDRSPRRDVPTQTAYVG